MNRLRSVYPDPGNPGAVVETNLQLLDDRLWGQEATTYAASVTIDFASETTKTIELTGALALDGTGMEAGRTVLVRLVADGSSRALTPDTDWVFVGGAAPSTLAANKTALLELKCFGTGAADVVARYWVQS